MIPNTGSPTHHPSLEQAQSQLAACGLNLFAVLPMRELPDALKNSLIHSMPGRFLKGSLLLLGNGGSEFWNHFRASGMAGPDPVDHYSLKQGQAILQRQLRLGDLDLKPLYPGKQPVALQQLGRLAGWDHPSPLGLGINAAWGLWYAYRALFACTRDLPRISQAASDNPCNSCQQPACIRSCPAGALALQRAIDINACAEYRLAEGSPCADHCISREACPQAPDARYSDEQIHYHYRHSLRTLREYYPSEPRQGN